MAPARWRRIEGLFDAAVELAPEPREALLATECRGDEDLRREVAALLAAHDTAGGFLEPPAPDPRLLPGAQLGPYRIISLLGAGGMGEVYLATDTRLERRVAVKLLTSELGDDARAARRFRREQLAVSALNHPHICTLHDVGVHEGQPFLVMELVEGRPLKQRLLEGAMPADEVIRLGIQLADALEAAHAKGIVHRDIKPANIFVTPRVEAKVLDFGLAKLLSEPALAPSGAAPQGEPASTEATISMPGWTPGTIAYMSPEQARGEPVDARTDLFSLGVTLYEIATGQRPFRGESPAEVLDALLSREPVRPRKFNPAVPAALERIIIKAIAKDPAARYQSAGEFRAGLERARRGRARVRWPLAAAGLILGLLALFAASQTGWFTSNGREPRAPAPVSLLAVLPLRNLSPGTDQALLAEGLTDAIAADVAQLPGLRVIARGSTQQYQETGKTPGEIARELNAGVVVSGSADVAGPQVQIRLMMTRRSEGAPFWSNVFDFDFDASFAMRREVARVIAREIRLEVSPRDEQRLLAGGTANRIAFEQYVRARHYWSKRTDHDIQRAAEHFNAAIDADPVFAAAYAGLADCHNQFATVMVGRPPGENRALAMAAARRGIELDERNAEAHAALGFSKLYNWDWAGADRELSRALELNPSYASARVWRAAFLLIHRRFDEAIAEVDLACELDPLSPITRTQAGWIRLHAGRAEDALSRIREVLKSNPDYPWALGQLGGGLCEQGRYPECVVAFEKSVAVSPDNPAFLGSLGMAYAEAGRRADALRVLRRLRTLAARRYVTPYAPMLVCLGLRDMDCYFESLEEGFRQRINYVAFLSVSPSPARYSFARQDPRFQDLLRRVGPAQ